VSAGEALFVGDSPHDMAAGRAAGTRTAGALWGPFPHDALVRETPDWLLGEPEDVLDLVG
jgi:pyrophosphatase PpaX